MTATMTGMEYVFADELLPDQVMEGDLIEFQDEYGAQICIVTNIEEFKDFETGYTYLITGRNEYHEELEMVVHDINRVKLFVMR
jgi:hypothetical protein